MDAHPLLSFSIVSLFLVVFSLILLVLSVISDFVVLISNAIVYLKAICFVFFGWTNSFLTQIEYTRTWTLLMCVLFDIKFVM